MDREFVDLGISVKWATMNVGATSVTDYGKYYAWGETKANGEEDTSNGTNYRYNSRNSYVKSHYSYETYKWCNGSSNSLTKYNNSSSYGTVDNRTGLELSDDAASQIISSILSPMSWAMTLCIASSRNRP